MRLERALAPQLDAEGGRAGGRSRRGGRRASAGSRSVGELAARSPRAASVLRVAAEQRASGRGTVERRRLARSDAGEAPRTVEGAARCCGRAAVGAHRASPGPAPRARRAVDHRHRRGWESSAVAGVRGDGERHAVEARVRNVRVLALGVWSGVRAQQARRVACPRRAGRRRDRSRSRRPTTSSSVSSSQQPLGGCCRELGTAPRPRPGAGAHAGRPSRGVNAAAASRRSACEGSPRKGKGWRLRKRWKVARFWKYEKSSRMSLGVSYSRVGQESVETRLRSVWRRRAIESRKDVDLAGR